MKTKSFDVTAFTKTGTIKTTIIAEDWGTAIKLGKKLYGEDTIVHYS
jgi:hypothetical protein